MAGTLKLVMGRERKTHAMHPSASGYVDAIRAQMAQISTNMQLVADHVHNVTPDAIRWGLQPAFDESQRLVPKDTLKLMHSGFIEVRQVSGGAQATIGYARYGRPDYATFVHERLDIRHAPPTQAKFLEVAIDKHMGAFGRRVALFIRKNMGFKDS